MREFPARLCLVFSVLLMSVSAAASTTTIEQARAAFESPLPEYSSGPLWVWNDLMTDEEVTTTLRELHDRNVLEAFVHPRPGLMTPYMGEEWLRLWKVAIAEAEKLGMKLWIYDENSYPSGFAGGLVPDAMPDAIQKGFTIKQATQPDGVTPDTLAVFSLANGAATDVTTAAKSNEALTTGSYLTINLETPETSPWYAGFCYVDLMRREVTDKFLEVTFGPYVKAFGDKMGKTVLGSFTDEPNIRNHALAYTPRIFELFQQRWGYDLRPQLASLFVPVGNWKQVRHNYFQLLNELFTENWIKPYHDFCEQHKLQLTGHFWDHEWPNVGGVPDDMAMYMWEQRPAIDCLMNNYAEDTHGQFGNARMARELSSVANQMGRPRTLCETYGAGGWDLRFEDQKRIADWLAVLGVNTFNQHLTYTTIRGARKRDHPQSFSYHEPWWQDYTMMGEYLARLSAFVSQGQQMNDVLLLQPTTTAFMYQLPGEDPNALKKLGAEFQNLHIALERAQVEYDIGSEYVMERHGKVAQGQLQIGQRFYRNIVIPPCTENLNRNTWSLLRRLTETDNATIYYTGELPRFIDGKESAELTSDSAALKKWQHVSTEELCAALRKSSPFFQIDWKNDKNGILFHQRRRLNDGELVFMVNTSIDTPAKGSWWSALSAAERWNLETGKAEPATYTTSNRGGITGEFIIPPCGNLALLLKHAAPAATQLAASSTTHAAATVPSVPSGELQVHRDAPNVLLLDYVDLKVGDELVTGTRFYKAAQKAFRKHGANGNPWESAVQFKDQILKTKFSNQLPTEITYRFTIEENVPRDLCIVIERPDLYEIACNGKPIAPTGDWWLDRCFGKLHVADSARVGENEVKLRTDKFTVWHEIESAYVIGSFALVSAPSGFTIRPAQPLKLGSWKEQGMPLYGEAVTYRQTFNVNDMNTSYVVQLGKWYGSVARVKVNGQPAGHIAWAPWQCDITSHIKPGENAIDVSVVGTLKNTLGPHHFGNNRGSAWPKMFQAGPDTGPPPGKSYDVIDYGLFEPFRLMQSAASGLDSR